MMDSTAGKSKLGDGVAERPSMSAGGPVRSRCDAAMAQPVLARIALAMALVTLVGCQQGQPAPAGSPWGAPAPNAAAANPTAPAAATATSQNPLGRQTYMADLQRRADEQAKLAAEQQRRLLQLQDLQRANEAQLAKLRKEQLEAQTAKRLQEDQRDDLLVSRARDAVTRYDEMNRRAQQLDQANRSINAEIARVQQRNQLLEDQNNLLRRRLEETSQQLNVAMEQSQDSQQKLTTMMASARRRGGATITANNSYRRNLTAVTVAGLNIRQDGEVVRIELPADRLFETGTARLRPEAPALIDQVAAVIEEHYPRQVIGVEAHTDNAPLGATPWRNAHQLTAAQAMSVFEHLGYRHNIRRQQMFVLGHGENYPLSSNGTAAGQARNRRVEIVVHPEQVGQR